MACKATAHLSKVISYASCGLCLPLNMPWLPQLQGFHLCLECTVPRPFKNPSCHLILVQNYLFKRGLSLPLYSLIRYPVLSS